jgi:glycosyltransferase involved in cell wall biosynthesis
MRIPSPIANLAHPALAARGQPFGLEVVGDPYDVFSAGIVKGPLGLVLRSWFTRAQRRQCDGAACAAYVTERALQNRYPCRGLQVAVSDVELPDAAFVDAPRVYQSAASGNGLSSRSLSFGSDVSASPSARVRLVFVGSLEQYYKAPDIVIAAVSELTECGWDLELAILGDGVYRHELEALAARKGVADRILFHGMVSADAVREQLDAAHLFVLPSRTEGLPRAMLEAMARGVPCLGSFAGGIPELLEPEDLAPAGDAGALVGKIVEVLSEPRRLTLMSARNLDRARAYRAEVLDQRRQLFLTHLKQTTHKWLEGMLG